MKIYLVGGAVRDELLGLPIKERDWVVVGAEVETMLKQGFQQVGKDFPVFLHPKTNEEYALARRERKTALGYKGFQFDASPEVTLEDDLKRRDLTINAMAKTQDGEIIDPYHGQADLANRCLRHVSDAFSEDPVRILRVGRFLARYAHLGFEVAADTLRLMQKMVDAGEVNALVPERVWKELERALAEPNPEKFFAVLEKAHALPILFPHLKFAGPGIQALISAAKLTPLASVRFAALLHAMPEDDQAAPRKAVLQTLCKRFRIPTHFRELVLLTAQHHETALTARDQSPEAILALIYKLDYFRRKERFNLFMLSCQAIANSKQQSIESLEYLLECAQKADRVDIASLLAAGLANQALAEAIRLARLQKLFPNK